MHPKKRQNEAVCRDPSIAWLTAAKPDNSVRALQYPSSEMALPMKVRNSIKSLRRRHRDNRVVRRRGRIYVINKTNGRFKARQG